ncbi:MAG: hypothetical protein QM817_15385 [Archangium sp.]
MATHPLAPNDIIENAKSGRSSCRACRKKIDAGTPRYGLAIESYDEEIAHIWFHLACGAKDSRGGRFQVVFDKYKEQIPELAQLWTPKAGGGGAGGTSAGSYPYIEKASTGRSKCMTCNEAIVKDDERLAVERTVEVNGFSRTGPGYMHLKCAKPEDVAAARAKQGAKPVAAEQPKPVAPAAVKKAPPPKDHELGIIQKPDDASGYLVWGDALQSENDPLGALIAAASSGKASMFTSTLKKTRKAVLGDAICKALDDQELELEWRYGVVHKLRVACEEGYREEDAAERLTALMTDVFAHRAFRFVREIELGVDQMWWRSTDDLLRMSWALEPIAKAAPPVLRSLTLGTEDTACQMGGVHHVLAACPRLEKLVIHGDAVSWSSLQGPVLTTLEHHGDLTVDSVKAFAQLPSLTSLTLDVVRSHGEPRPVVAALEAAKKLEQFTLKNYVQADEFLSLFAKSPVLKTLTSLTLDCRNIGGNSVAALTANAKSFPKGAKVSVLNSKASKSTLDALEAALGGGAPEKKKKPKK